MDGPKPPANGRRRRPASDGHTKSVAVIGAGIGGMAAAAHLARRGLKVVVYEKNSRPGGRCDRITRRGHAFDTGPTLFIMPQVYEREFARLGDDVHARLNLRRVDPSYHLVFDDGTQLALSSDMACMRDQLEAIEPGSTDGYARYLEEGRRHYDLALEHLVERDFRRAGDFFHPAMLPMALRVHALSNHYRRTGAFVHSPRLRAAFTFQDIYMGLSPFEAPATFSMMPYSEFAHGVWYPEGGMSQVAEAVHDIAVQSGVEFQFNCEVEAIPTDGRRALGVQLEHAERVPSDFVVANADLPYVYKELLPDDDLSRRLEGKAFSCSVISFYWGLDTVIPELGPHTLFLVDEFRSNFESLSRPGTFPSNPSLYLHAPARLDPRMAPPGEDTLIAIVPVAHLDERGQHDAEYRDRARQAVFDRLARMGRPDFASHIKFETAFTPRSWRRRYNLMKGATHGLSHGLSQLAYFRPDNCHPRYENVYFVGASTRPGTGIPTTLISARLTATRLADEHL